MNKNPVVITAALPGAKRAKEAQFAYPVTPEQIAADVVACAKAGAASELCSFDVSSINWLNDSVFLNVPKFLMKLGQITKDCGIKPELVSLLSYDQSGRLYMAKDVPTNNVLQVKRAVELVNLANRSVATTAEARVFLNFPINTGSKLP